MVFRFLVSKMALAFLLLTSLRLRFGLFPGSLILILLTSLFFLLALSCFLLVLCHDNMVLINTLIYNLLKYDLRWVLEL